MVFSSFYDSGGPQSLATVSRVLKPGSWYESLAEAIRSRAGVPQVDAMPADQFAQRVVKAAMTDKPPAVVRLGKNSTILPLLKSMVPTRMLDKILKRKFGLQV